MIVPGAVSRPDEGGESESGQAAEGWHGWDG
jgi:hypothetical protein